MGKNKQNLLSKEKQQKHALRLIHNQKRFYRSKELFESCQILNLYKLSILNTVVFMHKIISATCLFVSNTFLKWKLQDTTN